jgi:hypothetical protein
MIIFADREPDNTLPCRTCGADSTVEWVDVTAMGDDQRAYMSGFINCPTPRCGEVCIICRREVGDIHKAECGRMVIDGGVYVTKGQCR